MAPKYLETLQNLVRLFYMYFFLANLYELAFGWALRQGRLSAGNAPCTNCHKHNWFYGILSRNELCRWLFVEGWLSLLWHGCIHVCSVCIWLGIRWVMPCEYPPTLALSNWPLRSTYWQFTTEEETFCLFLFALRDRHLCCLYETKLPILSDFMEVM